jgi:SET domain-containing protein
MKLNKEILKDGNFLQIKRSIIPGAGKGLFTRKQIRKGTRISEYKGRVTTWKKMDHKNGGNPYIFYVNKDHVIDAWHFKKAKARYANDAKGLKRIKGVRNNAKYIHDGTRVFLEAKKNIPPGSEILVDYGKEYWDAVKYNNNIR